MTGDVFEQMALIPDGSVDLILTSPPFLALRSYLPSDHPDKGKEIGGEANPAAFIDTLLRLTAEWERLLAPHGSICIELGDTYSGTTSNGGGGDAGLRASRDMSGRDLDVGQRVHRDLASWPLDKSLALIPELYRIALAYGINTLTGAESPAGRWRVRNVVRWHRPNPAVGALGDKVRPSTSDMVMACKSRTRWFDLDAVRTPFVGEPQPSNRGATEFERDPAKARKGTTGMDRHEGGAPPLDTWIIPTAAYSGSHYAVFPAELCVKPIKMMCPERVCTVCGEPSRRIVEPTAWPEKERDPIINDGGRGGARHGERAASPATLGWTDCGCSTDGSHWRAGVVLDPFGGSGTVGQVATGLGRNAVLIDLDERNVLLAEKRIGMFLEVGGPDDPLPEWLVPVRPKTTDEVPQPVEAK